jgi:hypothetical protein
MPTHAKTLDLDEQRAKLLHMPDFGKVRQRSNGKHYLDFWPDIKGRGRHLSGFIGKGFEDKAQAELILNRINARSLEVGLEEAVNQFRSMRSKVDLVSSVIESFLRDAPSIGSLRNNGELYSPRTLDQYRDVLRRAQPYFEGMTMRQFCKTLELLKFKGWFAQPARPEDAPPEPGKYGRGLETDTEMANCFAALRAVVRYYQLDHEDFSVQWPPIPTKGSIAKKARKERNSRNGKREASLSTEQVASAIYAIDKDRQGIYWVMFLTQCRICEARGILGVDYVFEDELDGNRWERGRLWIARSATRGTKDKKAEVRNTTKTGVDGNYLMPEYARTLIARHCLHARLDPSLPLFRNPDCPPGTIWTHDDLVNTWQDALDQLGLPWVPLYESMKHAQVSALRDGEVSRDDVAEHCRWTSPDMLERYDRQKDKRRDKVTSIVAARAGLDEPKS